MCCVDFKKSIVRRCAKNYKEYNNSDNNTSLIIQLFFSRRKESKEVMLKETAAPLNGGFELKFWENGLKGT